MIYYKLVQLGMSSKRPKIVYQSFGVIYKTVIWNQRRFRMQEQMSLDKF